LDISQAIDLVCDAWSNLDSDADMIKDPQILRAAQVLMDQHGENSMVRAALVADKLEDQGDIEASLAWRKIIEVIDDLTRCRRDGELID